VTVFVGCGFAAKYREGGGNFSVPLQWMLGLQRLRKDAVWLEYLPGTGDTAADQANIRNFQRQLREHGLGGRYCLLYDQTPNDLHELDRIECIGLSKKSLTDRLRGPNVLLNLSNSIHPPLLLQFERRLFCDLDPSEIFYWMTKLDMGQKHHHEFWTIGLNANEPDCRMPNTGLKWKTFYPLADTKLLQRQPRPRSMKFTTVGQWYWNGRVEVDGEYPDLSKKFAFEPYLHLPRSVSDAEFELAMNINPDDPERDRLKKLGWKVVAPHVVTRTPRLYRKYLASAAAEFTAIKGVDVRWRTGWLSDRAAAFAALGRPVITEDSGADKFLPRQSGFHFVANLEEAAAAARKILGDWNSESRRARECAVEVFDSVKNLKRLLGIE
jgi:hypothetical protein